MPAPSSKKFFTFNRYVIVANACVYHGLVRSAVFVTDLWELHEEKHKM